VVRRSVVLRRCSFETWPARFSACSSVTQAAEVTAGHIQWARPLTPREISAQTSRTLDPGRCTLSADSSRRVPRGAA
jgi:hypothetical protein